MGGFTSIRHNEVKGPRLLCYLRFASGPLKRSSSTSTVAGVLASLPWERGYRTPSVPKQYVYYSTTLLQEQQFPNSMYTTAISTPLELPATFGLNVGTCKTFLRGCGIKWLLSQSCGVH